MSDVGRLFQFAPYKVQVMTVGDKVYGMPFDFWASPACITGKDYCKRRATSRRTCRTSLGTVFIEIGKRVEAATGKKMMGLDVNDAELHPHPHAIGRYGISTRRATPTSRTTAPEGALETRQDSRRHV